MDIAHHRATDKNIFHGAQVRVFDFFVNTDVVQLDVEVLVDALEGPHDFDVVFQLDSDLLVDEGFEEASSCGRVSDATQIRSECILVVSRREAEMER